MVRWYDRIGNTIEMCVGKDWIKGKIIDGDRTGDGIISMITEEGKRYWCGSRGEYVHYKKCEDSVGDLITNADRIRNMTDEELAKFLEEVEDCGYRDASITPIKDGGYMDMLEWLQAEAKEGNSNENT